MKESLRMPVAVYQIYRNEEKDQSFDETVYSIITIINNRNGSYSEEPILANNQKDFSIRLFTCCRESEPKWVKFLNPLLDDQSPLHSYENKIYSFILFIGYDEHIFAVTGGSGSIAIDSFISQNFGLEILTRVFSKDNKVVKGIQERGVTGIILGQTRYYRGDQRFSDESRFGKIFKQVRAELNDEIMKNTFGFTKEQLKRASSGCMAKNSFLINKSVDLPTLLVLVKRFAQILKQEANFPLNKVKQLSKRDTRTKDLREALRDALIHHLYACCKNATTTNIDFCHQRFEDYFNAHTYSIYLTEDERIQFDKAPNFDDIISKLKYHAAYNDDHPIDFKNYVLLRELDSWSDDGKRITSAPILHHVHGEVKFNDQSYFLVDGEWYHIDPDFIKELNEECHEILEQVCDDGFLPHVFDLGKPEHIFNQQFLNQPDCMVLDTIVPENLEPCDVIKFDNSTVYLIHVKRGFDNSMRELCSQINLAAKRLRQDLKTGYSYLKKVEHSLSKRKKSSKTNSKALGDQLLPAGGIKSIFENRKLKDIVFCLAVADTAKETRQIKSEIRKFDSNIAKYSLIELNREINLLGFGFKVVQLTTKAKL